MSATLRRAQSATLSFLALSAAAVAQQQVIPVWPGVAPGSEKWTQKEVTELRKKPNALPVIRNVVRPTITVYEPASPRPSATAVIVCPGGGGIQLDWTREGTNVGRALAARGITAFVLKYRVLPTPASERDFQEFAAKRGWHGAAEQVSAQMAQEDLREALRLVRRRAEEWKVDRGSIGVMGFSAGGGMVINLALEHTRDTRPEFVVAVYGGDAAGRQLPADVPPLFAASAQHDDEDSPIAMANLFMQWHAASVPAELHIFTAGARADNGHFRAVTPELELNEWMDIFVKWLNSLRNVP